jgi:hypothetical protein
MPWAGLGPVCVALIAEFEFDGHGGQWIVSSG